MILITRARIMRTAIILMFVDIGDELCHPIKYNISSTGKKYENTPMRHRDKEITNQ